MIGTQVRGMLRGLNWDKYVKCLVHIIWYINICYVYFSVTSSCSSWKPDFVPRVPIARVGLAWPAAASRCFSQETLQSLCQVEWRALREWRSLWGFWNFNMSIYRGFTFINAAFANLDYFISWGIALRASRFARRRGSLSENS